MAVVKRESGSWKSVVGALEQKGIKIENIYDLPKMLNVQKDAHAEAMRVFEKENKELKEQFNSAVENLSKEYDKLTDAIQKKFEHDAKKCDEELIAVQSQARGLEEKGIFARLSHLWTIITLWQTKNHLKSKRHKLFLKLGNELKLQKKIYDDKRQKINKKNATYQLEIEKKVKTIEERVSTVEATLKSGAYSGAIAELRMIDLLSKLPDNYYVMNDVTIKLDGSAYFDGKWLSSAQIDHLVVGPAGIFVIEVKNWSEKFSSEGDFFDPYQQVKRHNYVCYTLINEIFPTKVRSIIAYAGHIPTKPDDSYVKVLPLEKVNGYILWFKDVKHDAKAIQRIAQLIEKEIESAK